MALERLVVVDRRLDGNIAVEEVSPTELYARHKVVIVLASMHVLCINTYEQAVLLHVVSTANAKFKLAIYVVARRDVAAEFAHKHPIVNKEVSCVGLHTEVQLLCSIVTEVYTRE